MSSASFDFSGLAGCADLADEHAEAAVRTRAGTRALLDRMLEVLMTVDDACHVVRVLARLPTEDASEWVDGWLELDLSDGGDVTYVEITTSLGGGLRERLLPKLTLRVRRAPLVAALEQMETAIEPLCVLHGDAGRVKLVPAATGLRSVRPRAAVAIAENMLVDSIPPLAPDAPHEAPPSIPPLAPTAAIEAAKNLEGDEDLDGGWES